MASCKHCGVLFNWGRADDKWVPLVPVGEEGELDRDFSDENGVLRSSHRQVCNYIPSVNVIKLSKPVPADMILGNFAFKTEKPKRKRKAKEA